MKELFSPKLILEVVVIVAGVLMALAADRWNQDRADRQLETAYLERFVSDIRGDSSSAEAYLETFEVIVSATDTLLRFVEGGDPPASMVSTVTRSFAQFNLPAASTWNEMMSSSSLGLVRNIGVREVLSDYYGSVRPTVEVNLVRADRRGRDPFTNALYPMGLFLPCMPGQECAVQGIALDGGPDNFRPYRAMNPNTFREWPGMRGLLVGLGSHHGTQRLFAQTLADAAGETLRALEAAR